MCLITYKPVGKEFDMEILNRAAVYNKDGYGVMWWEKDHIDSYKAICSWDKFKNQVNNMFNERDLDVKDLEIVLHMRTNSAGHNTIENVHPFDVLGGKMVHNGTIYALKSRAIKESDTKLLAEEVLMDMSFRTIFESKGVNRLFKHLVYDSRFVFMSKENGKVYIFNEDIGEWKDGCWYSKDNWLKPIQYTQQEIRYGISKYNDYSTYDDWETEQEPRRAINRRIPNMPALVSQLPHSRYCIVTKENIERQLKRICQECNIAPLGSDVEFETALCNYCAAEYRELVKKGVSFEATNTH